MNSQDLFQDNVIRWTESCPKAAKALLSLKCQYVSLCKNANQEWNIKRHEGDAIDYYHSTENAMAEAERWFQSLNLYGVKTLFVYGVGLGYYFLAAKKWLQEDPSRSLIFLEHDLEVIHLLFEIENGKELMHNPQVRLHYFKMTPDEKEEESSLFSLPLIYFVTEIHFTSLEFYAKKFASELPLLNNHLDYIKNCRGFQLLEYINYGETFFQNFFRNLFALPSAYLSDKMFGKFAGVPAIICGAGPSLEKSIPLLETLSDRALIFAGGSSINTISINGLLPHFCVSIDPNWNQYARLFMNQAFQVPFFYRNRIFPQALSLIQGDRLYVPGSGGHELAEYFEENLRVEKKEPISEGNNVVNFSVAIAAALGCNPIVLVGVDLAYTDNKSYSPGIVAHPIFDANREITTRTTQEDLITKTDIYGKSVNTLWKWVAESMWITQFAVTNPGLEIINATEGGIGFEGIKNIPLNDLIKKHFSHPFDLQSLIHGEIQNAAMPASVTKEQIITSMDNLTQSLRRCSELCLILKGEFHKTLKKIDATQQAPENLLNEDALKALKELHAQAAFEKVLYSFNKSFIALLGKQEKELEIEGKKEELNQVGLSRMRTVMNKKRYEFLRAVCTSCLQYIKEALSTEHLKDMVYEAFGKKNSEAQSSKKDLKLENSHTACDEITTDPVKECSEMNAYVFNENADLLNGCRKLNYPSGTIKMEQYFQKGKLHGPSSYYSENGSLLAKSLFVHGFKEGISTFYYSNGADYSTQKFKNGKWDGVQEFYYPNGKIKSLLEYKSGKLHGSVILYYPDGFKMRELYFQTGKREGLEILWNIGGIKEFEGNYVQDVPVGKFRIWYPAGTLSREFTYNTDGHMTDAKGWNVDGTSLNPSDLLQKDYFGKISEQTHALTQSLEGVFKEIETMTSLVTHDKSLNALHGTFPDFSEDLIEIQSELENLKSINAEMEEGGGIVSRETSETIWKTPATRKLIGRQIQNATEHIAKEIHELENVMKMVAESLAKKDPKPKNQEPDSKEKS